MGTMNPHLEVFFFLCEGSPNININAIEINIVYFLIQKCDKHTAAVQDVSVIPQRIIWLSINHLLLILTAAGKQAAAE